MLKTDQAGHWYKCKNSICGLMLPLPDNIFIVTNYKEAWEARCKCGHINNFMYSDAQHETTKREVDKYFGIKDKVRGYWEK